MGPIPFCFADDEAGTQSHALAHGKDSIKLLPFIRLYSHYAIYKIIFNYFPYTLFLFPEGLVI